MVFEARAVTGLFQPGGPLSELLHPYEPRPQQSAMAEEVALVLQHGGRLVAEAPTGVGKSLAYLVPALAWARQEGRPVVVATFTRALQDQLLRHDAPLALKALDSRGTVATLKGRANYLCRRRLQRTMAMAPPGQNELWLRLSDWADRTDSGDFADCDVLDPEGLAHVISRAASDPNACAGNRCSPAEGCFFKRARALAASADVIIVNHALLTIELLGEKGMLPEHGALVIDEGHHLEDAATRQMTIAVGARRLKAAGESAQSSGGDGVGALLRKVLTSWDDRRSKEMQEQLREWQKVAGTAAVRGEQWFGRLNSGEERPGGESRRRYIDESDLQRLCPVDPRPVIQSVDAAVSAGRALSVAFADLAPLLPDPDLGQAAAAELDGALKEWQEIQTALDITLHPDGPGGDWVHWKEWGEKESFNLVAAPGDVSGPLGASLRERHDRLVLTSATLTVAGDFDHVLRRTGLPRDTATLALDSPFDFESSVRILAMADGPDPRDGGYADFLARSLEELVRATRKKTLALFTSYHLMREVQPLLKGPLADVDIRVTAQGRDGSVTSLLRQFRKPGAALLLGTASFWEGIDLPGEALEVLVVTRLPFPVPTDPLVEARGEELKRQGYDPFMNDSVPEAVLRLRQGFGRLIRRQGDRGVVAILDTRLVKARYGGLFRAALPCPVTPCPDPLTLAELAREWMIPTEAAR